MIESFLKYSADLTESVSKFDDVLGLVFLGSAADTSRVDEWSDHDFFLIVKQNCGERFRTDLSWIADHDQIAISPRETDHGLKVVFEDGRVLEFAVFEDSELEMAAVNSYAVALDRNNITSRMQAIQAKSHAKPFNFQVEFELLLSQVLIGVGRARRGEVLIAGQHLRAYCMPHLLGLIVHWVQPMPGTESVADNLNRFRRFEKMYPELAARIEEALQEPVEACARSMVHLVQELGANPQRGEALSTKQLHQIFVVRNRLAWV
jgi:hypothetical protein